MAVHKALPAQIDVGTIQRDAGELGVLPIEIWFSDHPIEEPQRQQAQKLLEGTERLWRERVPAARRWKQRFLTCQVI